MTIHGNDNPEIFSNDHYIVIKDKKWPQSLLTRVGKKGISK
jgi:hypothetical protein